MPPPKIQNFYDQVEKKLRDEEMTYDSEKDLNIKLTFRMLLIGSTGSGKTNTCINLVMQINAWDKILLFAKNVEEPLWAQFIKNLRQAEKETHTDILTVDTDITHLPSVDKWDKKSHVLLILDDMMSENAKAIATHVVPWFTRGRKKNASCIWLGQSFYEGTPLKLRQNSEYVALTKIRGNNDLYRILSEYPLDVTKDEIVRLYHEGVKGGFPNFFMVDLNAGYGKVPAEYRYRRNFEPLKYKSVNGEESGTDKKESKDESAVPASKKRKKGDKDDGDDEKKAGEKKPAEKKEKKGRARGRVGVTVTPTPSKRVYENKRVLQKKELSTIPDTSWQTHYSKAENERRLDATEVWLKSLTPAQQARYQKTLLDQGASRDSAQFQWVRAVLHDDDEAMEDAREAMEEEGEEELLGRHTEHMEEGDGLRKKRRRVTRQRSAGSARSAAKASASSRPLARHTTEQQKALERLAGRRQHAYWS